MKTGRPRRSYITVLPKSHRIPAIKDLATAREKRMLKVTNRVMKVVSGPELQEKARRAGNDAVKALWDIVRNPISTDAAKISAAQTLLDRGYGRPTQTTPNPQVNPDGKPKEISDKELDERITQTITRIEKLEGRKREKIASEVRPADIRKYN